MIVCSTGENLLHTPSLNATPTCSETLQHFNESQQRCIIYPLNYEALQRFTEALSHLTRSWYRLTSPGKQPLFRLSDCRCQQGRHQV